MGLDSSRLLYIEMTDIERWYPWRFLQRRSNTGRGGLFGHGIDQ